MWFPIYSRSILKNIYCLVQDMRINRIWQVRNNEQFSPRLLNFIFLHDQKLCTWTFYWEEGKVCTNMNVSAIIELFWTFYWSSVIVIVAVNCERKVPIFSLPKQISWNDWLPLKSNFMFHNNEWSFIFVKRLHKCKNWILLNQTHLNNITTNLITIVIFFSFNFI